MTRRFSCKTILFAFLVLIGILIFGGTASASQADTTGGIPGFDGGWTSTTAAYTLPNGNIFVAGISNCGAYGQGGDIYNPTNATFTAISSCSYGSSTWGYGGCAVRANGDIVYASPYYNGTSLTIYEINSSGTETNTKTYSNKNDYVGASGASLSNNTVVLYNNLTTYTPGIYLVDTSLNVTMTGTWAYGSAQVYEMISLSSGAYSGDVLMGGASGDWEVVNSSGYSAKYGVASALSGSPISGMVQRPDGSILMLGGGHYVIYDSSLSNVLASGTIVGGSPIPLSGGNTLVVGTSNQIIYSNNAVSSAATNSIGDYVGVQCSDGTVIFFGNTSCYHGYFDAIPTTIAQDQTTITLSMSPQPSASSIPCQYEAQTMPSGGSWSSSSFYSTTTPQLTGLSSGTTYSIRARFNQAGFLGPWETTSDLTIPATPNAPTGTTVLMQWSNTAGRGKVVLNWPAVTGATGYAVWVFDGNQYDRFDVGNTTSWDSSAALIYPDPTWLASQSNNSISTNPFNTVKGGFNLQDNPNILYLKTIGTTYDSATNYWFRVSAYDSGGESPTSNPYMPTLPTATDTIAPSGSASALSTSGLTTTYTTNINVTVNVSDNQSGIYKVELSNDGTTYTQEYLATRNPDNSTGIANYNNTLPWNVTVGAGTKTVYVRITDSVGNQTVTTAAIALASDTTAPTVTMQINSGATSTTSPTVTLTFTALDPVYPNSQLTMRLSNDGNTWTGWQTYATSMSWNITNSSYGGTTAAGVKTIWVQVANPAPCIGYVQGTIGYNSNPPTGSVTVVGGTSGTYNGAAALFTNSDNPTLSMNFTNASQIRFDTGAGIWGDWQTYSSSMQIATVKSSGVCKIRIQIQDAYGVTGTPQTITLVIVPTLPAISTLAGWGGATCTTTTSVSLELDAAGAIPGQLQYRYQINGGSWSSLATLTGNQITVSGLSSGANSINVGVDDATGNETRKTVTIFQISQ